MRFLFPGRNRLTLLAAAAYQVMTGFLASDYVTAGQEKVSATSP
jgi:hypothetical protein